MPSLCPTCRGRGTIRILTADPEPPQIVPCTRCRGTGHHQSAVPRPMRDKALRPDNRKPEFVNGSISGRTRSRASAAALTSASSSCRVG